MIEVEALADRAGFKRVYSKIGMFLFWQPTDGKQLAEFARLVAESEREECAKVAESWATEETASTCANVAEAIRARSKD